MLPLREDPEKDSLLRASAQDRGSGLLTLPGSPAESLAVLPLLDPGDLAVAGSIPVDHLRLASKTAAGLDCAGSDGRMYGLAFFVVLTVLLTILEVVLFLPT